MENIMKLYTDGQITFAELRDKMILELTEQTDYNQFLYKIEEITTLLINNQ